MASRARLIASLAHHGQTDAIGAPYWGHLARVAAYAETIRGRTSAPFDRYDVEAVAWLHDVLEDTPVTYDELRIAGMNPSVCQAVALLTHRGQPRAEYLSRVAAQPLARLVKIADTLDNTNPVRRAAIPDADRRERLARKYDGQLQLLLDAAGGTITADML
jgi:(p)ppGpp synthase/HD superfamily hydrolase